MATILTPAQRRFFQFVLWLAVFMLANSLYLFTSDGGVDLTAFYQLMLIGHLVGGSLLLVLTAVFVVWHLRRVRKFFRFGAVFSGVGLTVATIALFATGLFIISEANSRDHRWMFYAHQALAILGPLFYGVHRWVSHFPPERRMQVRAATVFALLTIGMWVAHYSARTPPPPAPPPPTVVADPFVPFRPVNYPDPDSIFAPASTTTSSGAFFPARIVTRGELGDSERIRADIEKIGFAANVTIGAETCRRCHADIVKQWESSAHRFSSFNNIAYRAAVEAMRDEAGFKKSQFCAGCHDPAIMLAGNMEKPIDPLTPESQAGLTCLACHAIDKIHGLHGNGNYNVADETPSPYLFDDHTSGWQRFVADQLTKAKPAAHKRMFLKPVFRRSEYCLSCHKVSLDVPINDYKYIRGQ
ncbi:MAG: cytochrome c family protein, partial [Planctomycetota bacterium]|nr:cytochrome c family protein [Planctomycetota bacterium]